MTTVNAPWLSVVIAAHDAASTLPDQLAPLVAQAAGRPWEILVCDNGSRDGTRRLVQEWAAQHRQVRLVDAGARRGPAAARNIGVEAARGDVIAFVDADDVVGDGWADAVERALTEHAFVAGRFDIERLHPRSRVTVSWSPQLDGLTQLQWMPGLVTAGAGNMAMRREIFDAVGGFDETLRTAEDDDLCLRAQLLGHRLHYEPRMVLHVRRRSGLRQVFRHAVTAGAGAHRLAHKYARVAAELAAVDEPPSAAPATTTDPGQTRRRLARLLRPETIANLAWRIGWRLGWRTADLDGIVQPTAAELRRPGRRDGRPKGRRS